MNPQHRSAANLCLLTSTILILATNLVSTQAVSSSESHAKSGCPKLWIHLGHNCYRIFNNLRHNEGAKSRCTELSSELALIEDDGAKERETSSPIIGNYSNILAYIIDQKRLGYSNSKQYYIRPSLDLIQEYNKTKENGYLDHLDPQVSDLWLPRDDPYLANLTAINLTEPFTAFGLVWSPHYERWGILPVSSTKKLSFICERLANSHHQPSPQSTTIPTSSSQHQILEPKRSENDLISQPSDPRHLSIGIRYEVGPSNDNLAPSGAGNTGSSSNGRTGGNIDSTRMASTIAATGTTALPDSTSVLFREFPQDQSIVMGSTAELRCSALEFEAQLGWTFNGRNLTTSNRIKLYSNGTLRIEQVRNSDVGNYTCTIQSSGMSESKAARLEIIERPHPPEMITAELLDKLSTSVRVKWTPGFNGNSPITKYLAEMRTVNNDYIPDSEVNAIIHSSAWETAKANISADQTSVIIPDLKPARKYIFRIRAINRIGTGDPSVPTSQPIEVPVQPPSMAPESFRGSPKSSTSIALQWSPPPQDSQNGALKGYKIRHKLAGYASETDWYTSEVADAAHLTFILEDLIVWQNYEIQIAAENDKGVGPYSSSIFVRTKEGRPDKSPRSITTEAISSTSIKINWMPPPPQQINGQNQGYKIQLWYDTLRSQLAKELTVPHSQLRPMHSALIDGLDPYTDYHVTIKCYTNAGDGPPNDDNVIVKTKQDKPEAVPMLEFAEVLDKSLRVLWKPPKRINGELDHYTLEYWESQTQNKRQKQFAASTLEARITDLIPETLYTFKIYPHTNVGSGPARTNETRTSIPPVLPVAPKHLMFTDVGPHSVNILFEPGFNGNAMIVKWIAEALISSSRAEHGSRWQTIYESTNHSQDNAVVVRNLRPFTKYRIRLTPVNIVGPSEHPSEPTSEFQTAQVEPEQPPRDLSVDEVKSTSAIAHWSPLANNIWMGIPIGYNLTWAESNNATVQYRLINDTHADSYQVTDLEEFTEYMFKIYAVNEAGLSPPSETVVITTMEDVPSHGPTNLTAHAISSNAVSIDWNTVPKRHRNGILKGYKIQYQAAGKTDAAIQYKTVEDNSTRHVTLNDLKPFTTYNLAVAAFNSVGDGVYSNLLNVQTHEDTPGLPQNLSSPTVSQTSARILWDPPEYPNGDILGYKVTYTTLTENNKEISSHELHANERTFKANNLKSDTHYVFTVTAKTKEGWGQQASLLLYTHDSELRANLPFYRESWFVILCACLSCVITIIVIAALFIQTKSYKYKQDAIKSTSQDRLGDAGFTIDDEPGNHYNNGFGLLSNGTANHRRSNGTLNHSVANFTLPKSPPRPHPGSVVYSDGDDDVFEDIVDKTMPSARSTAGNSNYDSSGDSLTEKPSEVSSSTAPETDSADDEYVNMANKHFVNHYANVNGTLRGQKVWKKHAKQYSSSRTKPKLPQRPAPSVPQVPSGEPSSSGSDNPMPGTSGLQKGPRLSSSIYGESSKDLQQQQQQQRQQLKHSLGDSNKNLDQNTQPSTDLLDSQIVNLNGGRIIVNNMAGSRAPLPGFTSFV